MQMGRVQRQWLAPAVQTLAAKVQVGLATQRSDRRSAQFLNLLLVPGPLLR